MNNKLYILDTDHVSLFQRQHPVVVQHLAGINANTLAVTIITVDLPTLRIFIRFSHKSFFVP